MALSGRVHLYEGHPMTSITFAMRVLGRLGVPVVILTNAAGGINTRFGQGALMLIDDHINLMGTNPLIGPNDERFGPRFPDMSEVYSSRLRSVARDAAAAAGVALEHGIYLGVHGPSFETPAEIRAFRAWGADAVGMSTVPEVTVARHAGMRVLGISGISNIGILDPTEEGEATHEEVLLAGRETCPRLMTLLRGVLRRLDSVPT